MSKKLQVLADPVVALDPTLVIFFGNEKISISKKITSMGSKHQLNPTLVFFFEMKFFYFQKNYKCWIKCISKTFTMTGSDQHL